MIEKIRKRKGSPRHYSDDFKQKVIKTILEEGIGASEASQRFGITNESSVRNWINKYNENQLSLLDNTKISLPLKELSREELEQQLKELEKSLAQEKMKNQVLNTLIDVAEEDLNISIRKKFGTKRFKK